MVDPAVRRARADDARELETLEGRARAGLEEMRGGARLLDEYPPIGSGWADVIDSPSWRVLVGEIDTVIVGYLALELPPGSRSAVVREVWVEPEARGLGFGDELLIEAIDLARAAGADAIDATALPGDRETKNLYERNGATARKIIVSKQL